NACAFCWKSWYMGYEVLRVPRLFPMCGPLGQTMTNCSGFLTGSRRSINWSIKVKMAVLAPIPNASEATATSVNKGLRRKFRSAIRTSDSVRLMEDRVSLRNEVFVRFAVPGSGRYCVCAGRSRRARGDYDWRHPHHGRAVRPDDRFHTSE